MSATGKDWGDILSRLNVSWGVKEVANIMSIINKRTTPVNEDEGLIKHVVYTPEVELDTSANTDISITQDIDETVDVDGYSGWGMRKMIPDNVRAYDLVHDYTNMTGITFPPPGITQFDATTKGRSLMGGAMTDGSSYMTIDDHTWWNATEFGIACHLNLPENTGSDPTGFITQKVGSFQVYVADAALGDNQLWADFTTGAGAKQVQFTYTPDTWFTLMLHIDSTQFTGWIDNGGIQGISSGGSGIVDTATDVGILGTTLGSGLLKSGSIMSWLTFFDYDIRSDSSWRSDYQDKGLLNLDDASSTEITTFPFQGDFKARPNSEAGMFVAT